MDDIPIIGEHKNVPAKTINLVGTALAVTLQHLSATDAANAAVNCADEVNPRPLTHLVGTALDALQEAVGPKK